MTSYEDGQSGSLGLTTSLRILLSIASVAVIIPFLRTYASLVNSFVIALIIVMTAVPVMDWMIRKRLPSGLAYLITLSGTLAITLILTFALTYSMAQFVDVLRQYTPPLVEEYDGVVDQLAAAGIDIGPTLQEIEPARVMELAGGVARTVMSGLSFLVLLGLIIIFMLLEALSFPAKIEAQLAMHSSIFPQIYSFSHSIRRYVVITAVTGAVSGLVVGIILHLMGIEFAGLWGLLYFIFSFIPTVGFWLALIPPLLLASVQYGAGMALAVLLLYMILSFILNQLVRPAYMGQGLDLSPLWVVVSLVVWSTVLGPPGIIIGVPLTIMVKELFLETSDDTRWLAGIMSSRIPVVESDAKEMVDGA